MSTETETSGTEMTEAVASDPLPDTTEPPRRRSRAFVVWLVVCALALVAGGVFGGMIWHQRSVDAARQEARDAGRSAAVELLSYDHRNLGQAIERRMTLLTGEFRDRYRAMVQDTVAPAAKARKVATTASVVASSVVQGSTDEVTLLLFVNQRSAAPSLDKPLLTGSRVRMTLRNVDGRWLTADLKPV